VDAIVIELFGPAIVDTLDHGEPLAQRIPEREATVPLRRGPGAEAEHVRRPDFTLYDRQVVQDVDGHDLQRAVPAFRQHKLELIHLWFEGLVRDHVIIGEDQPVLADDEAGSRRGMRVARPEQHADLSNATAELLEEHVRLGRNLRSPRRGRRT